MSACIVMPPWLALCSVWWAHTHPSESHLDITFFGEHIFKPLRTYLPPISSLFPIAFSIIPLSSLVIVCIESVPQNRGITHSNGDEGQGELTFLNDWSFQFVLPAMSTAPFYGVLFLTNGPWRPRHPCLSWGCFSQGQLTSVQECWTWLIN